MPGDFGLDVFSVTYQSRVADLVLQQLAVVFSCHELLFYLTTDFFFSSLYFIGMIKNIACQQSFVMQLIQTYIYI